MRPITGERTVLPVVATTTDSHGGRWLDVRLPGRPNSHTGWIEESIVTVTVTNWQIVVHLSTRQVVVFQNGRVVRTFLSVVGKPSTPTPTGYFFVEETVPLGPQGSGAPFALALSARSNALAQFDGGPGQVALHGIANIGGVPGTAVSHGCVRLATARHRLARRPHQLRRPRHDHGALRPWRRSVPGGGPVRGSCSSVAL